MASICLMFIVVVVVVVFVVVVIAVIISISIKNDFCLKLIELLLFLLFPRC